MKKPRSFRVWDFLFVGLVAYALIVRIPQWYRAYQRQGGKFQQTVMVYDLEGVPQEIPGDTKQVLIFWATWCGPCTVELARVQRLIDKQEVPADQIIAVSLDADLSVLKQTAQERGYSFKIVHDSTRAAGRLFGIEGTPTVYFMQADRTVNWTTFGVSPSLEYRISQFLSREQAKSP